MNENIRKVYVEFHTQRRLKIEALTEQRWIQLIKEDGRENSPHTTRDAYYWAMEQTSEEDELNVFAELIIKECVQICSDSFPYAHLYDYNPGTTFANDIKKHFGVE